ncbi:MAG: outer membrane protein assembly factor BamA [Pseudomonadota bacterium]
MSITTGGPSGQSDFLSRFMLCAFALCIALLAFSKSADAQGLGGTTINQIAISGNQRVENATILSFAGVEIGQRLTRGDVNAVGQRLRESGLFESVDVGTSGSTLQISVVEFPTINLVSIEGNRSLNDDALLPLIQSESRRVFSPQLAEVDANAIVNAYVQAGRIAASVTPQIIRRSDNRVDLVFEVIEGAIVEIERIGIVGNRAYSDRRLRRVLETKQAGLFRQVLRSDTFISDRIAFDQQLLTDFYRSRGYIDFRVLSVTTQLTRERDAFFITFNVQEGQQYSFGRVTASSDLPDVDPAPFQDEIRVRPGVVFSPVLVDSTIARLERLAVQERLNFIRVEPQVTRNDRDRTLDLDFRITRGPRVFVERIDIEGNTSTLDRVIRREFRVVEGDPFNPREIRQAAERIRALNYFASTEVNTREGSGPDRIIVDVDVVEQPTGSLSFGGSFSPEEGFGIAIGFSERNFLGRGQRFSATINTTEEDRRIRVSFTEPYLLGRDLALTLAAFSERNDDDTAAFDTDILGFTPSLTFPVGDFSRLQLNYRISQDEVFNVDQGNPAAIPPTTGSSAILREEEGTLITSSVGYQYVFDTRGRGLDPNRGVVLSFGQDFAGLAGDTEYVRTEASLLGEAQVFAEEVTLRATLSGGAVNMLGGTSRATDRYFGSTRIVRGFESNGFGPRDLAVTNQDSLGGNLFVSLRLDAEFPIGLPEEYGLSGGLFLDVGSVWSLNNTGGGPDGLTPVDDAFSLRSSIGVSVFWTTIIGPLRFDFATPLQKEEFDRTRTFDLAVSTTF